MNTAADLPAATLDELRTLLRHHVQRAERATNPTGHQHAMNQAATVRAEIARRTT